MSQIITITNLPATVNHTIYRGDSFVMSRLIREGGAPLDISADTFNMRILDSRGNVLHNLAIGSGITLAPTGIYQYALTPTQTAALPVNCELKYDVQWTRASGYKKTTEAGYIKVVTDITP